MDPTGIVAIVTGASEGIGAATARALARNGARLALAARSADRLTALAAELVAEGHEVIAVSTDISRRDDVTRLVEATLAQFGGIDLLVNNAGVSTVCPLAKMPIDAFQTMINLNVYGTLYAMQAVVEPMRSRGGGLIVNLSSMVSRQTWPSMGAYAATKHALNCLSETFRVEHAHDNIRVCVMFPGNTLTDFGKHSLMMVDPPTEVPGGGEWTADTAEQVASMIVDAVRREPHEQYMR